MNVMQLVYYCQVVDNEFRIDGRVTARWPLVITYMIFISIFMNNKVVNQRLNNEIQHSWCALCCLDFTNFVSFVSKFEKYVVHQEQRGMNAHLCSPFDILYTTVFKFSCLAS